ncbi:MAG: hypothetical protein ACRDH2_21330, partial [Anaerolineales bacterium]
MRRFTVPVFLSLALLSASLLCASAGPRVTFGPDAASTLYLPLVVRDAGGPTLGGCPMFPPNNPWNLDISA